MRIAIIRIQKAIHEPQPSTYREKLPLASDNGIKVAVMVLHSRLRWYHGILPRPF